MVRCVVIGRRRPAFPAGLAVDPHRPIADARLKTGKKERPLLSVAIVKHSVAAILATMCGFPLADS
jgi:hypothetical protein